MAQDSGAYLAGSGALRPRRKPKSPSRRQPHKEWYFNLADKIERQMQAAGYSNWGFVIYRTTYASDADWTEFLRRLRLGMEKTFDRCNGRDILDMFTLTVFDDPALFDGASTNTIRAHFREWRETAVHAERTSPLKDSSEHSARYDFCVQVDAMSLHSVVYNAREPPAPDPTSEGWVILINRHWVPIEEDPLRQPGWEAGLTYEAIDGVKERDVGWQKVWYLGAMIEYYYGSEGLNQWRWGYCRPPEVAT